MADETRVDGLIASIRQHIDAGITGNHVTESQFAQRDLTHSLAVNYGELRLLVDTIATLRAELADVRRVEDWWASGDFTEVRCEWLDPVGRRARFIADDGKDTGIASADSLAALGRALEGR